MDNNADKLQRKAIMEQLKRIKPGECQKYVRLVLDSSIISSAIGHDLICSLNGSQLKYDIRTLGSNKQNCIVWERSIGQKTFLRGEEGEGALTEDWQMENQVVQLVPMHELQRLIKVGMVQTLGEKLHREFPGLRHTLVVLCSNEKNANSNTVSNALIELQVLQQLQVVQINAVGQDLLCHLQRFTKSIAEAPYKKQKSAHLSGFKKFLANDNKQCVRIVGMTGLGRLWQQHLNRLPLVTLEVAETIIGQYSCPRKLIDAFNTDANIVNTIADLKINRSGLQPLQSDRRIGQVLSSKLHTLYNTRDPNALL